MNEIKIGQFDWWDRMVRDIYNATFYFDAPDCSFLFTRVVPMYTFLHFRAYDGNVCESLSREMRK